MAGRQTAARAGPGARLQARRRHPAYLSRGLALALALLLASAGAAGSGPGGIAPFRAKFALSNGAMTVGSVELRLAREGDAWFYSSRIKPTGIFALLRSDRTRERTRLAAAPDQLRPLEYWYEQDGSKVESVHSVFDWQAGQVITRRDDDAPVRTELPAGAQDRLSVMLSLTLAARSGFDQITLPVNEKGKSRQWTFSNDGIETIETPAGAYQALRITQQHEPGERHTVTWLAPQLDHLPIRLEQYRRGKLQVRMDLKSLDLDRS